VRVWGSIGFMASVLLFGALFEQVGMRYFPWVVLLTLLAMLIAAARLPATQDEAENHHTHTHQDAPPVLHVLRQPVVAWFFAGVTLTVLAHAALYAFFTLYLDSLGYGKPAVGGLWAVSVLVEIVWFTFQGRWLHRFSLHGWLLAAALASALRFALTAAFGGSAWVMVAVQGLHALTFAAQHTACTALVARYFPGRLRGRGQALYSLVGYGLSGVVGGLIGSALGSHYGYASVVWAAALAGLASALCCWRCMRLDRRTPRA
jgi:PPP family 3-phenylpropionic acid transporter